MSASTAKVTGKPGSNSSTISGRHNPNRKDPGPVGVPADKTAPKVPAPSTKPDFKKGKVSGEGCL